ncbi:hypothetical protein [Peptostreptococcus faecalis]|uniref:hypothetical protein n=1 Tax=Peptostreptococcus faecalis TaxID=2045015 RepID=UPI000C7BD5F8|nr:hypothetical protein [Peptostreptococcus faecalis]
MYVIFRDDMISSDDIIKKINSETLFKVETNLTKATKREDVMSFKLSIPVDSIGAKDEFYWENNDSVEMYFKSAEELTKDILKFFPKYTIQASRAYKWDEIENKILLVVVISNIDLKLKKLELDILKRMMKQVD